MNTKSRENTSGAEPPEPGTAGAEAGDVKPERTDATRIDGPQAEFISAGDAEYREQETGVKVSFALTEKEARECLKILKPFRAEKRRFAETASALAAAMTALLAGAVTAQGVYFAYGLVLAALAAVPYASALRQRRLAARRIAGEKAVKMGIYPDRIVVRHNGVTRNIPLDGTCEYAERENVLLLFPKETEAQEPVILPLRCAGSGILPEIQGMIFAGAKKRKIRC